MKENDEKLFNEEQNVENVSFADCDNDERCNDEVDELDDEEVFELDYEEEEEYDFDSWEEPDFKIELQKLEEDCTLSFHIDEYHSEDQWEMFESVYVSLKDNQALVTFEGSIKAEFWDGPENIQHLFKHLSEAVIESGDFIYSEDDDLDLGKWCTITFGVLIDKDFMFFKTMNHYMKIISDLQTKAKQKFYNK